jgi:dihydroorotate dehydrogenase electron transfer subunit
VKSDLYVALENRQIAPGIMRLSIQRSEATGGMRELPEREIGIKRKTPLNFEAEDWAYSPVEPGQFFMLKTRAVEPLLPRPLSVHEASGDVVVFLYQTRGAGTKAIAALETGDPVLATGPCGRGFPVDDITGRVALIAGGIGIAPFRYLARRLSKSPSISSLVLVAGFRSMLFGLEDIAPFVTEIRVATEDGSAGTKGFVTDIIAPAPFDAVLACGPIPMLKAVKDSCKSAGTRCLVSVEARMACGIGACLGCTINTRSGNRRVCVDGPVFPAEEVLFDGGE